MISISDCVACSSAASLSLSNTVYFRSPCLRGSPYLYNRYTHYHEGLRHSKLRIAPNNRGQGSEVRHRRVLHRNRRRKPLRFDSVFLPFHHTNVTSRRLLCPHLFTCPIPQTSPTELSRLATLRDKVSPLYLYACHPYTRIMR